LFGEEASKQTTAAIDKGRDRSHETRGLAPLKTAEPNKKDRSGEYHEIVAKMANEVFRGPFAPRKS
jgi:hypothetical protein